MDGWGPHGGQEGEAKEWVREVSVVLGSLSHVMGRQRAVWFGMRGGAGGGAMEKCLPVISL